MKIQALSFFRDGGHAGRLSGLRVTPEQHVGWDEIPALGRYKQSWDFIPAYVLQPISARVTDVVRLRLNARHAPAGWPRHPAQQGSPPRRIASYSFRRSPTEWPELR